MCPKCGSTAELKTWSWSRTETLQVGPEDSGIERKRFISRSTGYKCSDCGYKFLKYAKSYPQKNTSIALQQVV
jgi:DNA-directed RNA polymerase subunit RPC12/RpoP